MKDRAWIDMELEDHMMLDWGNQFIFLYGQQEKELQIRSSCRVALEPEFQTGFTFSLFRAWLSPVPQDSTGLKTLLSVLKVSFNGETHKELVSF